MYYTKKFSIEINQASESQGMNPKGIISSAFVSLVNFAVLCSVQTFPVT